jgi:DNA-binding transcriptional LysR family regulator
MNYRQLETFRAVMISGSASRAAELLNITQPAVSRSLADLERVVGFNLFNRVRGRLVSTPEAKLLMREVEKSFVGLDRLRSEVARIRDFGTGAIRIASLSALGSTLVPRAIEAFMRKHPKVAITLQIHASSVVRELVAHGDFDVGLAADEVDLSGVEHRRFGSFRALCAMPATHPLCSKATITPSDLHEQSFIALAPEDRARQRFDELMERAEARPRIIIETPASTTVCALALAGVGVGIVNSASAEGYAERGLQFRPFEPAVHFNSYLLFRPDAQQSRIVSALAAELLRARGSKAGDLRRSESIHKP